MQFGEIAPLAMGGFFLALGVGLLAGGFVVLNRATDSSSWPTAPGVVMASSAELRDSTTRPFELHVTYTYTVAGMPYTGDVVRSGGYDFRTRSDAEAKAAEYAVGSAVAVHYDPANPSRAVLETGFNPSWLGAFCVGAIFGVGGVVLLVKWFREA